MTISPWIRKVVMGAAATAMLVPVLGAVYQVGPSQPLATPSEVPWESLAAGDQVLIHWRSEPYRDKWVICAQGTESAPIVIRGLAGPGDALPVIAGRDAVTRRQLNYWNEPRGVVKIGGASVPSDTTPSHIVVENLEIRSGRPPYSFTADDGGTQDYPNNAAALYVEKGEAITIRNCQLHDSGNGLFVAYQAKEVLVERCEVYNNGNEGSFYEHNSYTAAQGIVFQYNRYGPLRDGCLGNNLKDRSAGLVVRYNWIEGGNRQLDLVDGEDSPIIQNHPDYAQTYVYGNVLIETEGAGNRQVVHYGGDSGNTERYRKGTLFFHHNTVVSTRTDRTTLFRLSSNDEQCDARNNIFYVAADGDTLSLVDSSGQLRLAHNWFKPGAVDTFGTLQGTIVDAGGNLTGVSPGFLDEAGQDYRLTTDSMVVDAGTALDAAVEAAGHVPTKQYRRHRESELRRQDGKADWGAFEYSPYAAWRHDHFGPGFELIADAADTADPDLDGSVNLLEYAFLTHPMDMTSAFRPYPVLEVMHDKAYLEVGLVRHPVPAELRYTIQVSEDLTGWDDGSSFADDGDVPVTTLTTLVNEENPLRVRLNQSMTEGLAQYLRVRVTRD